MRWTPRLGGTAVALLLAAAPASASTPVTPAGWRVTPAGNEISVERSQPGLQDPLGATLSPDGTKLLAASSGAARTQTADLVDLTQGLRSSYVPYDATKGGSVFYGVAFSPDGTKAWASGGGQQVVHSYTVAGGQLTAGPDIPIGACGAATSDGACFPAGLAYGKTPLGDRLYVADNLSGPAGGAAGNPPGSKVSVIDPATGSVTATIDLGNAGEPLGVTFDRTGNKAYVTNWLGRSVSVIDTGNQTATGRIELSPASNPIQADHPSATAANPVKDEVYTANANSDTVSVIDTVHDTVAATIDVALVPKGPKGAIPDGLAVSPDGKTLYVAEAGENAVAVVDLTTRKVNGFIPTAWYPSAVAVTPDGNHIVVTNANASGAGPNPCGGLTPKAGTPECTGIERDNQYSGSMIRGSVETIDVPDAAQLASYTKKVRANNQGPARSRTKPDALDAIKHVIYVIKENRTYDQMFGDLGKGNGDPSLALFKDDSAPNTRELARRFMLIDNFYADAEVSADGHNWATEAAATDYVDKTWPINYSPSPRSRQRAYDFEDMPLASQPAAETLQGDASVTRSGAATTGGYLWDNTFSHGVSFKDYGEYTSYGAGGTCKDPQATSSTTHLQARFGPTVVPGFPPYDTSCSDHVDREPVWERDFRNDVRNGTLPEFEIVRLPNDHTRGTSAGAATPQAYVADNDLAVGRLVDAVSHSPVWKSTAIFITEDDAQNGPDHVDAHRTEALVVSPYTQKGGVDSTHYDTAGMVATMEDLLGLPPMSVTDARASRMWASFTTAPRSRPYDAITPAITPFGEPGAPVNGASAAMAKASASWDFSKEDATPEVALNRAIWKSVKGRHSRMPAPRHVRIIGSQPTD
jgi:YVTN family beta-propeller protein